MKHTPRLSKAHDRQERETCLSCDLPECIPDHFACGLHGDMESRKRRRGVPLCMQCVHSILHTTDHPLVPRYYHCPEWGYNTMGWRKYCSRFRARPEYREIRLRKRKEQQHASSRKGR